MNRADHGQTDNGLEPRQQSSHGCGESRPPYELYETGISEVGRGWIAPILAFLKNRGGGEVVAVVAILALWGIATEFIKKNSNALDSITLAGSLLTAAMIFVIGLLAMLRATKAQDAENTQESQSETPQPGVGNERTDENGATPRPDRRT
jgi:hypothetical protein